MRFGSWIHALEKFDSNGFTKVLHAWAILFTPIPAALNYSLRFSRPTIASDFTTRPRTKLLPLKRNSDALKVAFCIQKFSLAKVIIVSFFLRYSGILIAIRGFLFCVVGTVFNEIWIWKISLEDLERPRVLMRLNGHNVSSLTVSQIF